MKMIRKEQKMSKENIQSRIRRDQHSNRKHRKRHPAGKEVTQPGRAHLVVIRIHIQRHIILLLRPRSKCQTSTTDLNFRRSNTAHNSMIPMITRVLPMDPAPMGQRQEVRVCRMGRGSCRRGQLLRALLVMEARVSTRETVERVHKHILGIIRLK